MGLVSQPSPLLRRKWWPSNSNDLNLASFLPPANEVWGKVIFLHLFVILFTGQGAWLPGGVSGCQGVCMAAGGCAWLLGGMVGRGHVWFGGGIYGC